MVSKQYRLPTYKIPFLYRQGEKLYGKGFVMHVLDNKLQHGRFTVVVSKKVDKRAVVRNAIKRKFRAALAELMDSINNDMIVTVFPDYNQDQPVSNLTKTLKSILTKYTKKIV